MVKNIRKIGITRDQTQASHVFVAEPYGEAQENQPDEDEIRFGAKLQLVAANGFLMSKILQR